MFDVAFHKDCIPQIAGQVAIYYNETEDVVLCLGTQTIEPPAPTLFFICIFSFTNVLSGYRPMRMRNFKNLV